MDADYVPHFGCGLREKGFGYVSKLEIRNFVTFVTSDVAMSARMGYNTRYVE